MKIFMRILFVVILFSCLDVDAVEWDVDTSSINNMSDGIVEQIKPVFKNKKLKEINSTIIIPDNYSSDQIIITPKVFDSVLEYNNFKSKYNIKINIEIKNKSLYSYKYVDDSFVIQTDDVRRYGVDENFNFFYNLKGFDGRGVLTAYTPYITKNSAIKDLEKKSSSSLLKLLKSKGGIYKYYLNYYNKKYNTNYKNLDDFDSEILDEIFSGKRLKQRINSNKLSVLSYNYFYNRCASINDISIGEYMRNNYNIKSFSVESKNFYVLDNMKFNVKKLYYFPVNIYMEFRLIKF